MCLFTSFALDAQDYSDLLTATTGIKIDPDGLLKVGERIWNLQKLYNIKRGFGRKDDTLPARLLTEPLKEGAPAGAGVEKGRDADGYYTLRGWDKEGTPTPGKLKELGLA